MTTAINEYRRSRGLTALEVSAPLRKAALWKSADMAAGGPYDHADADGRFTFDRLDDCGYNFVNAAKGENLANISDGVALEREVRELLEAWKASPIHEKVQTTVEYKAIGIARVSGRASVYWTVTFGSVADSEGVRQVSLSDARLPSLEEDPCLPLSGQTECDEARLALWRGDEPAWRVQLTANGVAVNRDNIILQTLYLRADGGSAKARTLLVLLGATP